MIMIAARIAEMIAIIIQTISVANGLESKMNRKLERMRNIVKKREAVCNVDKKKAND
jgi:hypothetical protein